MEVILKIGLLLAKAVEGKKAFYVDAYKGTFQ